MIQHVTIPVSTCLRRWPLLRSMLASLARTSSRSHEVVLVTEDDADELRSVAEPLARGLRLRVVHATPLEEGSVPVYEFLDVGAMLASEPWIMTPAGDDSYFPPGWERLLDAVDPAERLASVFVPRYCCVMPGRRSGDREGVNSHDGVRYHEFRLYTGDDGIAESHVVAEAERLREARVVLEVAGDRCEVSWPHAVMSRKLFASAGFFDVLPPFPDSHDLHLHERLHARGVMALGVLDAVIVNCKTPIRLGE